MMKTRTEKKCRFCGGMFIPALYRGNAKTCGAPDCLVKQHQRNQCSRHASQIRRKERTGDPPAARAYNRESCAVVQSTAGDRTARGHAGTNLDRDYERQALRAEWRRMTGKAKTS